MPRGAITRCPAGYVAGTPGPSASLPDPEPVFLSSPVLSDLERVRDRATSGPALSSYLAEPQTEHIDLHDDREVLLNGLRPEVFPLARWPSARDKPLVASQQFAVNTMLAELEHGGLFSVNGPPGTGKTTLLRDLIAAIVVRRAAVLACLPDPGAAFTARRYWTAPDGTSRVVHRLARQLLRTLRPAEGERRAAVRRRAPVGRQSGR